MRMLSCVMCSAVFSGYWWGPGGGSDQCQGEETRLIIWSRDSLQLYYCHMHIKHPRRWRACDGDRTRRGTWHRLRRSCWGQPDRPHYPPCYQAGPGQSWNIQSFDVYINIWLSLKISPSSVWPIHIIEPPPRRPRNIALKRFSIIAQNTFSLLNTSPDFASCPKELLILSLDKW